MSIVRSVLTLGLLGVYVEGASGIWERMDSLTLYQGRLRTLHRDCAVWGGLLRPQCCFPHQGAEWAGTCTSPRVVGCARDDARMLRGVLEAPAPGTRRLKDASLRWDL